MSLHHVLVEVRDCWRWDDLRPPVCDPRAGAIISRTSPPLCSQLLLRSLISSISSPLYLLVMSLPSSYHKHHVSSSLYPPTHTHTLS